MIEFLTCPIIAEGIKTLLNCIGGGFLLVGAGGFIYLVCKGKELIG